MSLSRPQRVAMLAALSCLFAGSSAPALAGSGGSTAPGAGTSPAGYGTTAPGGTTTGDAGTQPSTGDGTIAGSNGIVGTKIKFKGVANNAADGDTISVEAQTGDGTWSELVTTETDADGAWVARWKATRAGALVVRAVAGAPGRGTGEAAEATD